MAKSELIDAHVSVDQSKRAIAALLDHESKKAKKAEETELLGRREQHVWLVLAIKKMHPGHKLKPRKIPIAHPLVDPRTSPICLITKDPQREYKDLLEANNIKFISRVVGIEKLKGKFKPFEARRALLKENGMFLADERVVPLLPKLLGVKWFNAKKQPIPVCLTRKDLKGELERAVSSTYMNQNAGTCTSIKIGTLAQSAAQILANIKLALPAIVQNTKDGWDNVQSFHIKTSTSVSLPIWSCSLEDEGRFDGMILDENEAASGSDEEDEDEEVVEDEEPPRKSYKSKKRVKDEDETVSSPRKKAKTDSAQVPSSTKKSKTDTPVTSKKSKKQTDDPAPSEPTPAEPASSTSKGKKSKSSKETKTASPASKSAEKPAPAATKKSKSDRAKAVDFFDAASEEAPTTAADSTEDSSKKASKKRSKGGDDPDASGISEVPVPTTKAGKTKAKGKADKSVEPMSVDEAAPAEKPKSSKKAKAAEKGASPLKDAPAPSTSLSAEDLKAKRAGRSGEKKKEKVASASKGKGKSAKDAVLGKKPGRD